MRISDWSSDVCASDLRAAAQAEKGNDLMVAEADRQVVGFVSFGPTRTPALPYGGEVYALYVGIDWQGQGLGRRLLATALDRKSNTSELQSLMRISYAVFCLKKKNITKKTK